MDTNRSFKRWIPTIIFLSIGLIVMSIHCSIFGFLGGKPLRIDRIACNGGCMMAVRLPPNADGHQEQILVYPEDSSRPRSIRREDIHIRASQIGCGLNGELTMHEWEAVNALRDSWCASPPSFPVIEEQEPFYDLGLACGADPTAITARCTYIQIPMGQVPPELQMLVNKLPSVWAGTDCKEEQGIR